uniref:Uncharacterized protein n=1 Tax=Bionectria ochroleuca TaxID=29856 RepID=A0A0B7KGQ0_BIOOC
MLLEADVDVGAVNESGYTALDTALHLGCAEFIEVFSRDEDLLTRATNHLDDDRDGRLNLDEARRRIRAQMILMQQRSALDTPRKDKTLLDEVVNNPIRYLNLVSYEDLVTIFNEGSEAKRLIPVYHKLINEAIESENLKVLERIPMVCKRSKTSLVAVRILVEGFQLDPDAHSAVPSRVNGGGSVQIAEGGTALHVLASADEWWHLAAIKYLISKGADVNANDEKGCTPLHLASKGKNGDIVRASRQERQDLFHGAAGAAGTLGIVTLMEVRLVEAKKLVKTAYRKVTAVSDAAAEVQSQTKNSDVDYVDGIMFSKDHSVIITGQLTDAMPTGGTLRTFSNAHDPWFYMHVSDRTRDLAPAATIVEYVPLGEYLFRYDRAGFWVGRQGYTYFKMIPFTKFFRWLLDDYSHTRTLYHALHASGVSSQFVVQDLALPYETADGFINWVNQELGIWPLWLCPLRKSPLPSFHPVTRPQTTKPLVCGDKVTSGTTNMSRPMLNIGVWGWGPRDFEAFIAKNRQLESTLKALGGRKWLYSHTYYTEEEFWAEYDRPWYQALREKYFATTLPTIYDKVKVEPLAEGNSPNRWTKSWLSTWPIGGLYGMILATLSGDIGFHRRATWRHKGQ